MVWRFESSLRHSYPHLGVGHVEVAKWQTHQLEGLALERAWGFKSPLRHHRKEYPCTSTRGRAEVARQAHNLEVAGSIPAPATKGYAPNSGVLCT